MKESIKIAFDVSQTGWRKAGCGHYAESLFNELLASGLTEARYTLLGSFGDFYHNPLLSLALPKRRCHTSYGPRHFRRSSAARFWNDPVVSQHFLDQFDIVHSNNYWCPVNRPAGRLVYTVYDTSFLDFPQWSTELNRQGCQEGLNRATKNADHLVAISHSTKAALIRHYPDLDPASIEVVHPSSRFSSYEVTKGKEQSVACLEDDKSPFLLYVSTIEPRKNHAHLLKVYEQVRESLNERIRLVLAGKVGWKMEAFPEMLQSHKYASDIHLLGYVRETQLRWLYQNCTINLYPSLYEGFGMPVHEGMVFGAPTISSDSTSMPEIVGEAGILLSPHDHHAWTKAIVNLLNDDELRDDLSEAAKCRSKSFSWQLTAAKILSIYSR